MRVLKRKPRIIPSRHRLQRDICQAIARVVAEACGLKPDRLLSRERTQHIALARLCVFALAHEVSGLTPDIIAAGYGRCRGTIDYAARTVRGYREVDRAFAAEFDALLARAKRELESLLMDQTNEPIAA